tara:strand:+ start:1537 stop:1818 length:282 start_codon:yes stop_codon:yes gene_type:complete
MKKTKIEDISIEQLMKISKGLQPSKFTHTYWWEKAREVEKTTGLDAIESRALVLAAFHSREAFADIRGNIKFAIDNVKGTKDRMDRDLLDKIN